MINMKDIYIYIYIYKHSSAFFFNGNIFKKITKLYS